MPAIYLEPRLLLEPPLLSEPPLWSKPPLLQAIVQETRAESVSDDRSERGATAARSLRDCGSRLIAALLSSRQCQRRR